MCLEFFTYTVWSTSLIVSAESIGKCVLDLSHLVSRETCVARSSYCSAWLNLPVDLERCAALPQHVSEMMSLTPPFQGQHEGIH